MTTIAYNHRDREIAADAVEYAKTRDPFTGGKVNVFSVDSPRG